jgi:hypothetical protein
MSLATFILALFVFLQSAVYLAWFAIDSKLIGAVGIVFVIIVIVEAVRGPLLSPLFHRNQA